jgi:hypothetical protein
MNQTIKSQDFSWIKTNERREITLGMEGGGHPRRNPSDLEGFERKWSMRCERGGGRRGSGSRRNKG